MFGNSKEYQDIKKLYEEKVSKPENINEITGGLGPIPNANSNNNVKVNNNNNNVTPKTSKNIFQKIGDVLKSKPITGSVSRFKTRTASNEVKKLSNIPKDEGNAVINGKEINPNFGKPGGADTDTSSEIESSSSEFKANEGEKVNQRFNKDVGIVRRSQQTGKQRAQDIANKRIESGKSIEDVKKDNVAAMKARAAERNKKFQDAKKSGNLSQFNKNKLSGADRAKLMAKERIAAKQRLKMQNIKVENYTPYDMVLEYLMSTQQVATIEEANYVMIEMDEKTIQSIVEEQKKNLNEIKGLGKLTLGQIGSGLVKGGLAVGAYKLAFGGKGNNTNTNTNTNTKTNTPNVTVDKGKKKDKEDLLKKGIETINQAKENPGTGINPNTRAALELMKKYEQGY